MEDTRTTNSKDLIRTIEEREPLLTLSAYVLSVPMTTEELGRLISTTIEETLEIYSCSDASQVHKRIESSE